jgi:hypothetical protein
MAYTNIRSGFFLDERKNLKELNSTLLISCADFIDAALWLIAGNRLPQALAMLHNAIEVALKGELERIHKILIANTKGLNDFDALKSLLKDAFMKHQSGSKIEIPDFDMEKTILFEEAFDRVAELYPGLEKVWREKLISSEGKGKKNKNSLHFLRNDIVHYGGDPNSTSLYMKVLIDTAFPFIEEFLKIVSKDKVSLGHLVKEWIYHEYQVAGLVLRDLGNIEHPPLYAIKTLQHHMLWTYAGWPSPFDDQDTITLTGSKTEWEKYIERNKKELFGTWDKDLTVEIPCPVCGGFEPRDGSDTMAQVLLEREPVKEKRLVPEGFNCFICGLHILPEERYLARHFVGELPEDITTAYLEDPPR